MVAFLALPAAILSSGGSALLAIQVTTASILFIAASLGASMQLARTLQATEAAVQAAETANRAKTEFLANMSHEIRTPLNGVIGMADLLCRSDLSTRDREVAEIIQRSGRALEGLLSDVLDIARVEAGRIEIVDEPYHLGEVIRDAASLARLKAEEKGLALEVSIEPEADRFILGDCSRLRQITVNLLSNAVKFTAAGKVTVRAGLEHGRLVVAVADTGIGFEPDKSDLVFGRFVQADGSITRRFGGTGLGLAISRELAQLMGGELDAHSIPGDGSTFTLSLPFRPCESPADQEPEDLAAQSAPVLRILVADDHPTNRKVAELILAQIGAEVAIAEDGAQACERYRDDPFDVVLMDMQMPVMDGLEAVRRIRTFERETGAGRTPVLMLTANALPEHIEAGRQAGADGHVSKPIVSETLLKAILETLEVPQMRENDDCAAREPVLMSA
jgi:signal transduction histidine kinase/FixJ family two-component response regulator